MTTKYTSSKLKAEH